MSNIQSRILKHRIDVYNEVETKNESNEDVKTYTFGFYDRAQAIFTGGAEKMAGQMSYADKVMKFRVRHHRTRYNERQYLKWENDYYNIRSIDPDTDRKYMILTAERVPPGTITIT